MLNSFQIQACSCHGNIKRREKRREQPKFQMLHQV